jgi:ApbE superfamily uncharacterized protein (UPF0280 family)
MARAQIALLPDGRRLHLQDGPIDLIIEAWGSAAAVEAAYRAAAARFVTVLDELCSELTQLRAPAEPVRCALTGVIARRMHAAVVPFSDRIFITPMAAVAGAVAEEILGVMTAATPLARAYVNNGGDIALHLAPGESFKIAMIDRPDRPSLFGTATIVGADPVRGIATSGWRGRSFSLGIADAVTVLAPTAAQADAAATVIANAVDLPGHPGILRVPANDLQPDSDLGPRPVTRHVPELAPADIAKALDAGEATALSLAARRLILTAALHLQGRTRLVDADHVAQPLSVPAPSKAIAHA